MLTRLSIIGERCSGTNWIATLLTTNFRLQLATPLGFKHWARLCTATAPESRSTLVVLAVRNPIDWIQSFYKRPFNVPFEDSRSLEQFVRHTPWRSYRPAPGQGALFRARGEHLRGTETDFDLQGERFRDLIDLRTKKLSEWLEIGKIAPNFYVASYDRVLRDPFGFLRELNARFRLPRLRSRAWANSLGYKNQSGPRVNQNAHRNKQFFTAIATKQDAELLQLLRSRGWSRELCEFVGRNLNSEIEATINPAYGRMVLWLRRATNIMMP